MGKRDADAMADDDEGSDDTDDSPDMEHDMEHDMAEGRERRMSVAVRGRRRTAISTEATPRHVMGWAPRKLARVDSSSIIKSAELRKRLIAALKVRSRATP
jgi:hypothetical protein